MKTRFGAERTIDAPAAVVYHCLADYRNHHRPGGFLPPAFAELEIDRGGLGAGTEYCLVMTIGGRRRVVRTTVSEPVPGHKLVETSSGIETTFTVEQSVEGAQVRFDTVIDEGGLQGILNRLFAAWMFRPSTRTSSGGSRPTPEFIRCLSHGATRVPSRDELAVLTPSGAACEPLSRSMV